MSRTAAEGERTPVGVQQHHASALPAIAARWRLRAGWLTQERIVLLLAVLLFVVFSVGLNGFAARDNLLSLLRGVAVLGILGLAMALVVIGRGIDLSLVAVMAISVAWSLALSASGMSLGMALLVGMAFALVLGVANGLLIAYAEIPSLFSTLAMGTFIYGLGRMKLIPIDVVYAPEDAAWFSRIGQGEFAGVPLPVLFFLATAAVVAAFLRYTRTGRFIYAMGDNYQAARITGVPVRPLVVLQYAIASCVGCVAGIITAASVGSMNTRIVNSTMIYDVILVVVLGGIGLSGGKGGVRNVLVGTVLIGILLNGMTIMDIQYTVQNVIKSAILLAALVIDSLINPRDEQTAQQGDI